MKSIFHLAALFAALIIVSPTLTADDAVSSQPGAKKCCKDKTCEKGKDCKDGVCPSSSCDSAKFASAMKALPKMTYLVGTESTCCNESAASLASKLNAPIQYVVGEETFASKPEAMDTLISTTEKMVEAFVTPSTCHVSGTTSIAGTKCPCSVKAGEIAKQVSKATQLVSLTYVVGEESCNCPNKAAALAKQAGSEVTYVVGNEETCCNKTARLNLARAKYFAAVKAAAKFSKPQEEVATITES